jgi:putative salt-induced outer membrane protein YdiY
VLVNTATKFNAALVTNFSLSVAFAVNYDSRPAAGRIPTDTALTVGCNVSL